MNASGFVIVSADDIVIPILGYSTTSKFDATDIPDNAAKWLEGYLDQIRYAIENNLEPSDEIKTEWQELLNNISLAPKPLLFIVPRHPERFDEVAKAILANGFSLSRRSETSQQPMLLENIDVFLGDSMGEMPAYYRAADLVVMGGSFMPFGGQNLIEACAVGCPVIVGENTFNFQQATLDAISNGAAVRISVAQLSNILAELLSVTEKRTAMALAAKNYANLHQGATNKIVNAIDEQFKSKLANLH